MNSAKRNLQDEWSLNIIAQLKEVDFPDFWCSDLQYIKSVDRIVIAKLQVVKSRP